MISGYVCGIFPRSERMIEATRKDAKGLPQIILEEKRKAIRLQASSGLTHIADPLLDWDDMLRPLTDGLRGLERGALNRFYENNVFYRRPIVVDKLEGDGRILVRKLSTDLLPKNMAWKVELPDPYTFATLCEDRYYRNRVELMLDIAEILRAEAKSLVEEGFSLIQFNSPSLASLESDKDDLDQARIALQKVVEGLSAKTFLNLYLGDASCIIDALMDFKVHGLGIDFTFTKLESLKDHSFPKALACGCIDSRSTRVEHPSQVADFALEAFDTLNPRELSICPNCDLEFIPYRFAKQKVWSLGRALKVLEGSGFLG